MTTSELREFLTVMREFGVYECTNADMSFKISPSGPMAHQAETADERKVRIRNELKAIADEDALDEEWSV